MSRISSSLEWALLKIGGFPAEAEVLIDEMKSLSTVDFSFWHRYDVLVNAVSAYVKFPARMRPFDHATAEHVIRCDMRAVLSTYERYIKPALYDFVQSGEADLTHFIHNSTITTSLAQLGRANIYKEWWMALFTGEGMKDGLPDHLEALAIDPPRPTGERGLRMAKSLEKLPTCFARDFGGLSKTRLFTAHFTIGEPFVPVVVDNGAAATIWDGTVDRQGGALLHVAAPAAVATAHVDIGNSPYTGSARAEIWTVDGWIPMITTVVATVGGAPSTLNARINKRLVFTPVGVPAAAALGTNEAVRVFIDLFSESKDPGILLFNWDEYTSRMESRLRKYVDFFEVQRSFVRRAGQPTRTPYRQLLEHINSNLAPGAAAIAWNDNWDVFSFNTFDQMVIAALAGGYSGTQFSLYDAFTNIFSAIIIISVADPKFREHYGKMLMGQIV